MESIDPANLADVNKNFNKPGEYATVLDRLARRNIYAITSFIFGMDNDTPGVARRTLQQIDTWPPVVPVFGQLTPFPATPLYDRLAASGRLIRPKHWMDFAPFVMAHVPLRLTIDGARAEVDQAWRESYSSESNARALEAIKDQPIEYRAMHLIVRLFFRGIYFPQMNTRAWLRLIGSNRRSILKLAREGLAKYRTGRRQQQNKVQILRPETEGEIAPPAQMRSNEVAILRTDT
jgi:hypothetical protein